MIVNILLPLIAVTNVQGFILSLGGPATPAAPKVFDPNCKDAIDSCWNMPEANCRAPYEEWARQNCGNRCGYCIGPTTPAPPCVNKLTNCETYDKGVCTNADYKSWAGDNCRYFCRLCPQSELDRLDAITTTIKPEDCVDKVDCRQYGANACSGSFKGWSEDNCKSYCGYCTGIPTAPPVCEDKIPNCKAYNQDTCTNPDYHLWVLDNCKKYCGQCPGSSGPATLAPPVPGSNVPVITYQPPTPPSPGKPTPPLPGKRDAPAKTKRQFHGSHHHGGTPNCWDSGSDDPSCVTAAPNVESTTNVAIDGTNFPGGEYGHHHTPNPEWDIKPEKTTVKTKAPQKTTESKAPTEPTTLITAGTEAPDTTTTELPTTVTEVGTTTPTVIQTTTTELDTTVIVTSKPPPTTPNAVTTTTEEPTTTMPDTTTTMQPSEIVTRPLTTTTEGPPPKKTSPATTTTALPTTATEVPVTSGTPLFTDSPSVATSQVPPQTVSTAAVTTQAPPPTVSTAAVTTQAPPPTVSTAAVTTQAPPPTVSTAAVTTQAPPPTVSTAAATTQAPPPTVSTAAVTTQAPPPTASNSAATTQAPPQTTQAPPQTTQAPAQTSTTTTMMTTTTGVDTTSVACVDTIDNCALYGTKICNTTVYKPWATAHCSAFCGFCTEVTLTPFQCGNKIDNCAEFDGGDLCSATDYFAWARKNCFAYCGFPPCGSTAMLSTNTETLTPPPMTTTEIVSTTVDAGNETCVDTADNCFSFSDENCFGVYEAWAKSHCGLRCGFCGVLPCEDKTDCAAYPSDICTSATYTIWSRQNCRKFCNWCARPTPPQLTTQAAATITVTDLPGGSTAPDITSTTLVSTPNTGNDACVDTADNCFSLSDENCFGVYEAWSRSHCGLRCGFCGVLPCEDKLDCAAYPSDICTSATYTIWSRQNCRKFCNWCGRPTPPTTTTQ